MRASSTIKAMTNSYDTPTRLPTTPPELELVTHKLKRLFNLLAYQAENLRELQSALEVVERERDALLIERECLNTKIEAARLHVKTILEHLPCDHEVRN